jgi:cellulose synthase (UDP-forming)
MVQPQQRTHTTSKNSFLLNRAPKFLIVVNVFVTLFYFLVVSLWFDRANLYLFGFLIASQAFFTWQALTFLATIWDMNWMPRGDITFAEPVDVFITVAGEPVEIVEETVRACLKMDYPDFKIHILNDGYVAKKDNWEEMEQLAKHYAINCITRKKAGGAKAGNINNAIAQTENPFIVIFDADHVPHVDFLRKTMKYFGDKRVGFIQSPQYYKNFRENDVTGGSWEQQELFFGAILKGKNRLNSVTMCGTNMVIRRKAIVQVGGMCDTNIAEDFVTGLFIHQKGWKSVYVPEVLAEGLAPEDFLSYYKQQLRWARGSLEVLFKYNPLFKRGLTWGQKTQYLASASYYLSGVFILINILIPIIFFFFGIIPFKIITMALAVVFLPYIFLTIYTIQLSTNFSYTFRALSFSMSSWPIHIRALFELLTGKKSGFSVTAKKALTGNFLYLASPHIFYYCLAAAGIVFATYREGMTASVATNSAWVILNCAIFFPFIRAAAPRPAPVSERISE